MKLAANQRKVGKAVKLRQQGQIPGIVYNSETNLAVSVEHIAFDKAFRSQGTSHVITLDVEGEEHDVLVKAVQMDKRRREPIHIDFYKVTAGQTVDVGIVIEFVGTPVGVKDGGQLDIQRREVVISIVPKLIPEAIQLDISELGFGDSIHISDLVSKLPEEAKILDDQELSIVTVVAPRGKEDTEATEATQPEVIGEKKDDAEGEGSEG